MKDQKKTKGKARIEAMLREKRPLKVYTIKKEDCPEFAKQAKGYGCLLYTSNVAVPASIAFVIPQRPLVRGNAP